jgi:hypothetical protein
MSTTLCMGALVVILLMPHAADAWQREAQRICEALGVPYAIVRGIIAVESSGHPYVLNVAIGATQQAYRFENAHEATMFLEEALRITQRIDIGLMQVHWAVWKQHYAIDATALLDVRTNLQVGCDIIRQSLEGKGPLWQRIGRYHSRTPARNERYALEVLRAATR